MHTAKSYETRHAAGDALAMHRHAGAYAALVLDGSHVEASADGPIACEPGTLLLHPRFHAHGNRFGGRGARVVNLPLALPLSATGVQAYAVGDLREARQLFMHAAAGHLTALIDSAQPVAAMAAGWQGAMLEALRDSDLPVGRIAARLGISAAHASRALLRSHGMGPQALRRELRWRRALSLLRGTGSLADIALQAGFADQSHFNRVALAHSGLTPARLRAQVKSVQDDDLRGVA